MSKRIIMLIVIITISLGSISVCNEQISATTDTNKQTFYAVADAYIAENHPTYILTNQTYVRIRGLTAWHFNGLLQFDLSPIAPENTVSSAKLKLYYYSSEDGSTAGHTLNLYRITSNWNKENVTWNTRPSYNGTIIASAVVPSTVGTWIEWDVTNDVQSFINDQTVNYGWEIIDPASSDNSQTYFYSNEYGSDRPYLEIEFATATDTTKQTIYPTADAYIAENHPTYILNNETFVRIRGLAGWHFNGLFQFNITSIDTENTISSAKLKLYYYSSEDGSTAGHTLNLYRITSNWNKENVTWNTRPNYNGTIIASAVVPSTVGTWIEWDVTNDVQSFINDQTVNYGWEIIDPASSDNSQTYFYSNEYGNNLPALEIEFATDTDNYPTANPGGPYTGSAGTEVILNGSASYDLNGYITNYTWDFGEGNYSYGKIVTHTYTNKGTYTITLMVTDDTNAKNSEITTIIIQDTYSIEISSAKLKLYYYQNEDGDTAGHTLNLYRITSDWNKENVTWNTRPNYNGTIIASAVVPSTVGTWIEWDVTNDVQSFINGQTTNYGWEIIDPASSDNSQTYFYSNEYGNNLPALEIEFATDTSKQTFYPIADVYIAENHPTYILNNETFVRIRGLAGWHFNGLFQFDITSIVPGTSDHVEKTPGFEVLFILFASVLLLIWKRRK